MHRSWRVTKPALRAIGNIVCAEDEQVTVEVAAAIALLRGAVSLEGHIVAEILSHHLSASLSCLAILFRAFRTTPSI
jgi:hypothetical protein